MKALSGIKDVDLKILQDLEDTDFEKVCAVNKYVNNLCNDEMFWLNRFISEKNMSLEEIREIKNDGGDLKYKEIYWYLFIGNTYKNGFIKAIKTGNMVLFRRLWENKPHALEDEVNILLEIGDRGNKDATTYLFAKENDAERKNFFTLTIMSTAGETFRNWLFRTGILSYYQYLQDLIEDSELFDNDFLLTEIEKYLSKVNGDNSERLAYFVGIEIKPYNIEIFKKILKLILRYNRILPKDEIKRAFLQGYADKNLLSKEFIDSL